MLRGIYTGASGMLVQDAKMDAIANNLANVDKTAYKKDVAIFKSFPEMLIRRINESGLGETPGGSYDAAPIVGKLGTGVELNEVFTDFEQGSLQRTENNFDIALDGKGFFTVMTERGERYSRDGSFTINQDGVLMTHSGNPVMGENGIIKIQANNFMVNERGEITVNGDLSANPRDVVSQSGNNWANPVVIDKLKIVDFDNIREVKKEGDSLYRGTEYSGPPVPPGDLKVVQGFLEKSNINIVREMVDMIEVQRAYEANQKTVTSHDQALGKLINEVAR